MIRGNTLRQLQSRLTAALDAKAGQLVSGAISPAQFMIEAQELLAFAHSRSAVLGAFRAKPHKPPTDVAIRVAARSAEEQRDFLFRFMQEIAEGKYKPKAQGGKGARQRKARFALYAKRLGGVANEAWAETLLATDANIEALWRLGKRDRHCPDCQAEASQGWRPLNRFRFLPGQGRTRCFLLCGCSVTTREGAQSYAL